MTSRGARTGGGKLILVGGGARSGKSRFALGLAETLGKRRRFVATAEALDDEMSRRIARHRAERGARFETVEEPVQLAEALDDFAATDNADVVMVDCLTLWVSNLLVRGIAGGDLEACFDRLDAAVARRRAPETARPIADARDLAPAVREELREIDFGRLEGMTFDDVRERDPALYDAWMTRPTTVTFPGGEGFADVQRRVLAIAGELRGAHAGTTIAVVAHGGVIRALLADALRVAREDVFRLDQSHGAVNVVDFLEDTAIVRLLNHVP